MFKTRDSRTTPPSDGIDFSGVPQNGFIYLFSFFLLVALGYGLWWAENQKSEHETDYQGLEHQTAHKFISTPGKSEALVMAFHASEEEIINEIEAVRKTTQGQVEADDLEFLLTVALDPQLLKKVENLSRILGMFNRLPEGSLKEKLRAILCDAFDNELDICIEQSVASEDAPSEKENSKGIYSVTVKRTDPDSKAGKEAAEKAKPEQIKLESLAEAIKALEQSLSALKKLKADFAAGKIKPAKFRDDYALLRTNAAYILHAFRRYIKDTFKGKLPTEIFGKNTRNFQPKWEPIFRRVIKKEPNSSAWNQTLDKYDEVNRIIKDCDELVK